MATATTTPPTLLKQLHWERQRIFVVSFGMFILLAAALIGVWVWASTGALEESIPGIGQMVPEGKVRRIASPLGGRVIKVYVEENAHVKKGQLLVELDPDVANLDYEGNAQQLNLLRQEQNAMEAAALGGNVNYGVLGPTQTAWLMAAKQAYDAKSSESISGIRQAEHQYEEAKQRLQQAQSVVRTTETMLPKYRALYEEGGLSEKELREYEQKSDDQHGNVAALKENMLASQLALEQVRQKPAELIGSYRQEILGRVSQHQLQIAQLESQAAKTKLTVKYQRILAPTDGVINEQIVRGGGDVVQPGQTLMSLVPDSLRMVAEVRVANRDLAYVHLGQRTLLKMDAFPYQHFGRLYGEIISISPGTQQGVDPTGETTGQHPAAGAAVGQMPFYVLTIKPEKHYLTYEGKIYHFRSGMTLSADIITHNKNIMSFFTEPLSDHAQKAFKDPSSR